MNIDERDVNVKKIESEMSGSTHAQHAGRL